VKLFSDLELLAQQRGWKAEDLLALSILARLMKSGQPVSVVQLAGARDWLAAAPPHVTVLDNLPTSSNPDAALLVITDRTGLPRPDVDRLAVLRPPTLTLGIASRRLLEPDDLDEAFRQLCRREGYSPLSLSAIGVSARRKNMPDLEDFAERYKVPLLYYADAILARSPLPPRGRIAHTCAAAALLAASTTEPLVTRQPYFGRLTLSLARRRSASPLSPQPSSGAEK
jgi:cobalt-precorrin 5A hydrolase